MACIYLFRSPRLVSFYKKDLNLIFEIYVRIIFFKVLRLIPGLNLHI
jgi:hypothetical protein